MLKRIDGREDTSEACIAIKDAVFPGIFYDGLQYTPPARGTWNIVHTNMLVPDSHQIYICALGCLRGVVLTAAEMGAMERFSSIVVEEHHLYDGTMEDCIVDGVGEILQGLLPQVPKACFIYPACIHHFMGCDMDDVYRRLEEAYPQTRFVACWMDPIRRHSDLTAEMRTRRQLYSLLEKGPINPKSVNIVGSNLAVPQDCELALLLKQNGFILRELPVCKTYEDYEKMAESILNIGQEPYARGPLEDMERELGQKGLYLSNSFGYDEIIANLHAVADALQLPRQSYDREVEQCEQAFAAARDIIGSMPVAIDSAAVFRPFSLAKTLLQHGFAVRRVYTDGVSGEDGDDFFWVQEHYPDLELYSMRHAKMRRIDRHTDVPMLAIGQKAAYFTGTAHFVDMAENGGLRDFRGIRTLLEWMTDACRTEKEARESINLKGWGCRSCV